MVPGSAPRPLACPQDGEPLAAEIRDGLRVDVCLVCGGLWFDRDELAEAVHDPGLSTWGEAAAPLAPTSALACPRCGGSCFRSDVGALSLDTCGLCAGVWVEPPRSYP